MSTQNLKVVATEFPAFRVAPLDRALEAQARAKIDGKTKPFGALGRLECLALQICLAQRTLAPQLTRPALLLFAGDHGATAEGISAYPKDVTWQMVANFLGGGAAINVFCRQHGIEVEVVDAGVDHEFAPCAGLRRAKIAPGTANYLRGPAMTRAQCAAAIGAGAEALRAQARLGTNVVGFGEMGIGNTASASLLMHRLGGVALEDCVGRGTGLDDAGLARKLTVLAAASARRPAALAPLEALAEYGGFEIAMMAGAFLAAAEARMLILVDGFIAGAALLVASRIAPAVTDYCVYTHVSAERGHRRMLELLGGEPLLALELRLGEGSGAALAYPLAQSAVAFVNEMASFASAGVSERG
ncbi:MAG: nicotinate-nucleotide--dimethylbenzimidazole phosphoribosyltransferase [Betaproteobacteria bacterium]|nr:nicotinate-nucleotide--dimethylbenzimidazole phosphoribosyltransferase [Betaproteobacteria bacterium]